MFNEGDFISQVEAASTKELADLLLNPTPEQEKVLRAHLGDDRYQRMHSMALRREKWCVSCDLRHVLGFTPNSGRTKESGRQE